MAGERRGQHQKQKMLYLAKIFQEETDDENALTMAHYSKSIFGMFGGEETSVTLEVDNDMVGVVIDRFGKDITINPIKGNRFKTYVKVAVSPQFLGWVMSMGGHIRISEPEDVVDQMKKMLKKLSDQY